MVGSKGKVIAIEAHPVNYEILKQNIALNKLSNVVALNYAVHSRKARLNSMSQVKKKDSPFTIQ